MIFELYDVMPTGLHKHATNPPRRVGLTSGCFDLFHYYHLLYLERCRRLCDVLVVGVDSDLLVKSYKGNDRPVFPENHRAHIINSLRCVNGVFIMENLDSFMQAGVALSVDVVFKNDAFQDADDVLVPPTAKLSIVPDIDEIQSTTEFIKKIETSFEGK